MRLRKALEILLTTAFSVGFLSWAGGWYLMHSDMAQLYAGMVDNLADAFYALALDSARDLRNQATDLRDVARESHDYGIYCIVGAVFVAIAGAGWMTWRWGKDVSKSTKMREKALTLSI